MTAALAGGTAGKAITTLILADYTTKLVSELKSLNWLLSVISRAQPCRPQMTPSGYTKFCSWWHSLVEKHMASYLAKWMVDNNSANSPFHSWNADIPAKYVWCNVYIAMTHKLKSNKHCNVKCYTKVVSNIPLFLQWLNKCQVAICNCANWVQSGYMCPHKSL